MAQLPPLPLFVSIAGHDPESIAVVHCVSGRTFQYGELFPDVLRMRERLYEAAGRTEIRGERIAFLVENSYDYVVTLLAILAARAIALPLSPPFPAAELRYILSNAEALLLVHSPKFAGKAQEVLNLPENDATTSIPQPIRVEIPKHVGGASSSRETVSLSRDRDLEGAGMMLYTSGTTNRPKGVVLPHSSLTMQCRSLAEAWEYTAQDRLLHVLPLHHIHGTVNAVLTPLFAGSTVEFLFPFNADTVWRRLASPFMPPTADDAASEPKAPITFFTVVPTVYSRLLSTHPLLPEPLFSAARTAVSPAHMRVSISGSAALPTSIKRAWSELSHGTVLLERYGMTEVGMALSCGLDPADRIDGSVGWPLPGVSVRLVDPETGQVIPPPSSRPSLDAKDPSSSLGEERERQGEIQLRGSSVFTEYWRNPAATAKEFVVPEGDDGKGGPWWFKTGDIAVRRLHPTAGSGASGVWARGPLWYILGRASADIIKSGGEKVSALEVERELLSLPNVAEAAVVAVPSGRWGQKVGAVVVLKPAGDEEEAKVKEGSELSWKPLEMRRALRDRLAGYKIPQVLRVVREIPRNAMGKVNKKALVADVFKEDFSGDEA